MESTFALIPLLLFAFVAGFGLLGTIFWIWMIVDCATKESSEGNDKIVWLLIIIFTHWIGALIYFFVRRAKRIKEVGH